MQYDRDGESVRMAEEREHTCAEQEQSGGSLLLVHPRSMYDQFHIIAQRTAMRVDAAADSHAVITAKGKTKR